MVSKSKNFDWIEDDADRAKAKAAWEKFERDEEYSSLYNYLAIVEELAWEQNDRGKVELSHSLTNLIPPSPSEEYWGEHRPFAGSSAI